jgi:hypothetical protein
MLSETYQEIVVLDPILFRKLLAKGDLSFRRRLGLDVTPAVGNPVDMRIDTDAGLFVAQCHDKIRRLSSHAFELKKLVDFIGYFFIILVD